MAKMNSNLPVTLSSEGLFELGEIRVFSDCSAVESVAPVELFALLKLVSFLVGDVFSLSDCCLRFRYSFMDS